VLEGREVDAERMAGNLALLDGMVYSEALLLAMIAKGAGRQEAYRLVQSAAKGASDGGASFVDGLLHGDQGWLSVEEVHHAMDLERHLAGIAASYRALGFADEPSEA